MQRVVRVIPVTAEHDLRGIPQGTRACPTHWPDGKHAYHHCQYQIARYAPAPPMKDGWVDDLHEGDHRCLCGATLPGGEAP